MCFSSYGVSTNYERYCRLAGRGSFTRVPTSFLNQVTACYPVVLVSPLGSTFIDFCLFGAEIGASASFTGLLLIEAF
jgi:hypothetical protein